MRQASAPDPLIRFANRRAFGAHLQAMTARALTPAVMPFSYIAAARYLRSAPIHSSGRSKSQHVR